MKHLFASVLKINLLLIVFSLAFCVNYDSLAKNDLLQSGPMLGYSEMREVKLWVQTTEPAEVYVKYYPKDNPEIAYFTETVFTQKDYGYSAHIIADIVMPGKIYSYELFINGEKQSFDYPLEFQTLKDWQYKSEPPEFSFAFGSGTFINDEPFDRKGKPYGGGYEIYETIHKDKPDFMIWLGDNVYLREADWNTKTGVYYRYTQVRSLPEMQPLLASVHHYAIWDDHDFGPNNSNRSFHNKNITRNAFIDFWGNMNYGENEEGIYSYFNWGDADFFLLDNRWFRTPNNRMNTEREMLGKQQLNWLIDNLIYSNATFKFVVIGGQVLTSIAKYETYETFPDELNELLSAIEQENIEGVVFISGDRHFTELSARERDGKYTLYDITSSPLNSGAFADGCKEENIYRVEGTCVNERNYVKISISGKRKERTMIIQAKGIDGNTLWEKKISEEELKN
jgi:alkaline phosphatase D